MELKIGDRVKSIYGCTGYYPKDAVGTIAEVDRLAGGYYADFDAVEGVKTGQSAHPRRWFISGSLATAVTKPVPTARKNDPATSKGKKRVNKYEQAVLDAVAAAGAEGATGHEICGRTNHMLNCITPRFAPLRRKGLIKDSGQRRDKQIVWVLA